MAEQNNRQSNTQQIISMLRKQAVRQAWQRAKQQITKSIAKKFTKQAIMNALRAAFLTPPFIGWIVLGVILVLTLMLTMIFTIMGESAAEASEANKPVYETAASHQAYLDLEAQSYTAQSDSNNCNVDEYEYRLPWAVMSQLDTYLYHGEATNDQRQEMFNALKSTYSGDRRDNDTYNTYHAVAIRRDGHVIGYKWSSTPTVKKVERHIIPNAVTWSGTYSRNYSIVHRDERVKRPVPSGPNDTALETFIWQYEVSGQNVDYSKLKSFIKAKDPTVWDSQITMTIGIINILINQDDYFDTGLDNGLTDFTYGGIVSQGEFTWPTTSTNITSKYGPRIHPTTGKQSFHYGIDIGGAQGDIVVAAKDGVVSYEGHMDYYVGNYIKIDHGTDSQGRKVFTRYLHLSKFLVNEGDTVKAGQPIGLVGSTGIYSTGPHLHFEINVNGSTVDPMQFFSTAGGNIVAPSGDEMDLFIRIVNAEAGGEGDAGITGVVEVVRNRMTSRAWAYKHYQNVRQVLTDGNGTQFNGYWHINKPISQGQYEHIKYLINKVMNEHTNTVNGATFFTAPPVSPSNFASQNRCTMFTKISLTTFYIANADL